MHIYEASRKGPPVSRNSQLVRSWSIWVCLLHLPFWWPPLPGSKQKKIQSFSLSYFCICLCPCCLLYLQACYYAMWASSSKSSQPHENDQAAVKLFYCWIWANHLPPPPLQQTIMLTSPVMWFFLPYSVSPPNQSVELVEDKYCLITFIV